MVAPNTTRIGGKLFMKLDISTYQQKEKQDIFFKTFFSFLNLFKTSGFLPFDTVYLLHFQH